VNSAHSTAPHSGEVIWREVPFSFPFNANSSSRQLHYAATVATVMSTVVRQLDFTWVEPIWRGVDWKSWGGNSSELEKYSPLLTTSTQTWPG